MMKISYISVSSCSSPHLNPPNQVRYLVQSDRDVAADAGLQDHLGLEVELDTN